MIRLLRIVWRLTRQEIFKFLGNACGEEFLVIPEHCLILAPHPDDEVFGCGGLLSLCAEQEKSVEIVFLTNGDASHKMCCDEPPDEVGFQRRNLAVRADQMADVLPVNLHFFGIKDGRIPGKGHAEFTVIAEKIATIIKQSAPVAVFCPHPFDSWADHVSTSELTSAAISMLPVNLRPDIYYYCIWFWLNFPLHRAWRIKWQNARILDITGQLNRKKQVMRFYQDALAPCGSPWIGNLPEELLHVFTWPKEIYFKADKISF